MAKLGKKDRGIIVQSLYNALRRINDDLYINAEGGYLTAKDWDKELRKVASIIKTGIKVNPEFDTSFMDDAIDAFTQYHPLRKRGADYAAKRWFGFLRKSKR